MPTSAGPGRVIIAIYAILSVGAVSRSAYQLIDNYHKAPLAYGLSSCAAVVYCVATWSLATNRRVIATTSISFELIGVIVVGTWSVADTAAFPDATVWSGYGAGYVWVPLVLPLLGLWWLYTVGSRYE